MKKKQFLIVLVMATALFACSNQQQQKHADKKPDDLTARDTPAAKPDTLRYQYQTVHEQAADCKGDKGDCTYAEIKYPLFTNERGLNNTVRDAITGVDNHRRGFKIADFAKNFINDYYQAKKQGLDPVAPFNLDILAIVEMNTRNLLIIRVDESSYSGGAHGNNATNFINWDTKSSRNLKLEQLFVNGYRAKLTAIAEKIFRRREHLAGTASLDNYFFQDGVFTLNDNFYISQKGIGFFYNNYEIKPYSEGPTDLLIPYSAIKRLLRPNTVVSQFIK